jgi:hypothetical protein
VGAARPVTARRFVTVMLSAIRAYLYLACLWGVLCLPPFHLGRIMPAVVAGIDALPVIMLVATLAAARVWSRATVSLRVFAVLLLLPSFAFGNAIVVSSGGGSVADAAKYLAALLRPLVVLALLVLVSGASDANAARRSEFQRKLRRDLAAITVMHFAIALLQLVAPDAGGWFIPVTTESQSGLLALAEGDVSGLFPNSIDFAYFAVAGYIVLSCDRVFVQRRPPKVWMTAAFGFFVYASGSVAAFGSFVVYAAASLLAFIERPRRRRLLVAIVSVSAVVAVLTAGIWRAALFAKIDNMMLSRLGLIFVSAPLLVAEHPSLLLTGMGADFHAIEAALKTLPEVPLIFTYDDMSHVINDVFWVAMVLSLGLPFAASYLLSLYALMRRLLSVPVIALHELHLPRVIAAIVLLTGWLNQILIVRSFYSVLCIGLFAFQFASRGQPAPDPGAGRQPQAPNGARAAAPA